MIFLDASFGLSLNYFYQKEYLKNRTLRSIQVYPGLRSPVKNEKSEDRTLFPPYRKSRIT